MELVSDSEAHVGMEALPYSPNVGVVLRDQISDPTCGINISLIRVSHEKPDKSLKEGTAACHADDDSHTSLCMALLSSGPGSVLQTWLGMP